MELPSFWSLVIGRCGGVAIFCSPRLSDNVSIWQKDPEGHLLSLLISGNGVNLVNVYAPIRRKGGPFFNYCSLISFQTRL